MRISYGIACITYDKRIIIIKKRHSYAFVDWVNKIDYDSYLARNLIDHMSVNEKSMIAKLNFTLLAEEIGLYIKEKKYQSSRFHTRQMAFTNTFLNDGGAKLMHWLRESLSYHKDYYEIPKGHKGKNELPIDAAIREFFEETNITREQYELLDIRPHTITFIDAGQKYKYIYFIAKIGNPKISVSFKNIDQIKEVSSIHKFNLEELNVIDKKLYIVYKAILKRLRNKKIL